MARRMDASAYVDVFSYLSSESRHVVASRLVPARVTFDASRRTFTDEGQVGAGAGVAKAVALGLCSSVELAGAACLCSPPCSRFFLRACLYHFCWFLSACNPPSATVLPACLQEVDSLEAALREMELASMAKVQRGSTVQTLQASSVAACSNSPCRICTCQLAVLCNR